MKVDVLLGLQWGDEGKGKVVDVLTPRYDIIARFQGGPNAGHTLEFEGKKYVLRSIPSGIFQDGKTNLIGNGVVLDPVLFREEAESLEKSGIPLRSILKISKKVHLIMPTHRLLDAVQFSQAHPLPVQVYRLELDAPLLEPALRLFGVEALGRAEDLDVHNKKLLF